MSFGVYDDYDRRSVIAMEEFAQIMESPMFLQSQRGHHPHVSSFSDSFGSRATYRPETQPQLSFIDSFGLGHVQGFPEPRHHQPQLPLSDGFGSRATYRPEPQPQLSFSDSFGLGRVQRFPEPRHHQPQLPLSNSFGRVQRSSEPRHLHHQQPQLPLSDSFGHVQRSPGPRHPHPLQQPQLSLSDSFDGPQRLPEARYSWAQAAEPDPDAVSEPVKCSEKHQSVCEESIDREAGDFIKLRHKKFDLSK